MKAKKLTILKGEGANQHTVYGNVSYTSVADFMEISTKDSKLFHETPIGGWSNEHKTLSIPNGRNVMGLQSEFNPFSGEVTRILD
jgi:hypothetical protein